MDRGAQLEELDSLKSIYYSEEFQVFENSDQSDKIQAIFWAFLTLTDDYEVRYLDSLDSPEPSCMKLKHLPPIELRLTLPKDYPSTNPPEFVISCMWLHKSKISELCKKLDDIWSEYGPSEILYSWCDFLKNDSLSFLGYDKELDLTYMCLKHLTFIQKLRESEERKKRCREKNAFWLKENPLTGTSQASEESVTGTVGSKDDSSDSVATSKLDSVKELKDNHNRSQRRHPYYRNSRYKNKSSSPKKGGKFDERAVLNLSLKTSPIKILENYNTEREEVEFLRNFYTCNICFCDKLGKDCTQFKDCKHVFCINCIRSYFTIKIKDGNVQSIKCPEEKCMTETLPSQVKEIVSGELFAKYDSVLLTSALETLSDIIYCPRQFCQYPVTREPEEKMASCPNCQYVFCVTCKMVYHGIEPCHYKTGEVQKLIEHYESASDEAKQEMETRYGKKHLESLVNNAKAENWIKKNSKACPKCEAAIEKSQGCNKMVCWKCKAPFCWLCIEILDSQDPYAHFRDPQSRCSNKLFHLVHNLDEDWDWVEDSDEEPSDPEDFYFEIEGDDMFDCEFF